MPRIAVVTDSAACVPAALKEQFGIHVVAFELVWDGVVYRDGAVDPTEFYRRFRQAHTYPTTSQPPLGEFLDLYARLSQENDGIVSIHVSGDLTGTVRTAQAAAGQVGRAPIRVLDSRTATIAEGFVVLEAARAAEAGGSLEDVVAAAQRVIPKVNFFATLKTLEHVRRGGRLGDVAVSVGNQLKITPILNLSNGKVSLVGLTRSWEHALKQIVELTEEQARGKPTHVSAFHGDALKDAEWLQEQVCRRVPCVEFFITEFTTVMGAHTGPGVVGVAFYADG